MELAQKIAIDKITITRITDNCGLSQPTFYNHFRDKYDLMTWIYVNRIEEIMGKLDQEGKRWKDTLIEGARYFADNRVFMVNALEHTGGQDSFLKNVTAINEQLLMAEVRKKLKSSDIPTDTLYYIKIYCHGTVHFLFEWLTGKIKLTVDEVATIWENSLPEPLRPYLLEA